MSKSPSSVILSVVPPSSGGTKSKGAQSSLRLRSHKTLTALRLTMIATPSRQISTLAVRRGNGSRNDKASIIVLGVDPGTLVTGYGVVARRGNEVRMIDCGSIKNNGETSMPLRLKKIYQELCRVIAQYHPDEFAIESAFYGKNAQSALKLGHARGVCILAAVEQEIPTTEYSPREVKRAIVGSGAASKEQVQFMVKTLLRVSETKMLHDTSDALAIAICHAQRMVTPRAKHNDWKSYIEAHPEKIKTTVKARRHQEQER